MGSPNGQAGSAGSRTTAMGAGNGATDEPAAAETTPLSFKASDGTTCSCANDPEFDYGQRITLECFQDAFKACSPTLEPFPIETPQDIAAWVSTRHDGCGHTVFSMNGGFGGPTCIYDSTTKQLIGAAISTDTGFVQCSTGVVRAGVQDTCQEGMLCSLSGRDSSCIDAASLCAGKPQPCTPRNYP
jgi:hypothetical protein